MVESQAQHSRGHDSGPSGRRLALIAGVIGRIARLLQGLSQ